MGVVIDGGADGDIAGGVAAGEAAAFGELFDRHAQVVFRLCRRSVATVEDAQDVLSATFLEAWRCSSRMVLVEGSLRPWLLAIARNVARNHHRAGRRRQQVIQRVAAQPVDVDRGPQEALLDGLSARGDAAVVAAGIAGLPEGERVVAELCLLDGLSGVQAAHVLGIAEGTVRSRLFRARQKLQRLVQVGDGGERGPLGGHLQVERRGVAGTDSPSARSIS